MLKFRKIAKDDLGPIFEDKTLRTIFNIEAKGDWFGVLIENDGNILGGLTGYKEGERAVIQNIEMKANEKDNAMLEGLIRSTIYILDREGIKVIHSEKMDEIHEKIGFTRHKETIKSCGSGVLKIATFFNNPCGGCETKGC